MIQYQGLAAILAVFALTVLPVSLAARFADAERPGIVYSAAAVVLGGLSSLGVMYLMGPTLAGAGAAYLAMCVVYSIVLRVSLVGSIGVSVIAFFLQVVISVGIVSFGIDLPGIERPFAHPVVHWY